jgi:tetratricopeptide (TPR) repeat protein
VLVVPAGVDSSVAAFADSMADASFVTVDSQEQATALQTEGRELVEQTDSLWDAFEAATAADTVEAVTPEDSVAADSATTAGAEALLALDQLLRDSDVEGEALAARTAALLDSAQAALETAYGLNPFDSRSRLWLARVYELQARRLGQAQSYDRAVEELTKLTRLTPDQHAIFALLANNYFYLERWDSAAANYARAEDVYLQTFDLIPNDPGGPDSAQVFAYARAQGDMHVRDLAAVPAKTAYDRALVFAPTADDSTYVAGELEWMAWDDMNIASSFMRDSVLALESGGDLEAAAAGYAALLPRLSRQSAIDETDWRLAIVDYNLGNAEAAATRLQTLAGRIPLDSTGTAVDSTHTRYLDDYGTVCLNLGRDYLREQRDNRTALMYFEQATRFSWRGRAATHLEMASLLQSNPDAALTNATAALGREDDLEVSERRSLYLLLMSLHRRLGQFDDARRFRDAYRALPQR